MRQPAILDDLLNELSSMAISSAPGTDNILCGLGFNIKLYGLSWQIRILCRLPKAMTSSNISAVACAPVGMCGYLLHIILTLERSFVSLSAKSGNQLFVSLSS